MCRGTPCSRVSDPPRLVLTEERPMLQRTNGSSSANQDEVIGQGVEPFGSALSNRSRHQVRKQTPQGSPESPLDRGAIERRGHQSLRHESLPNHVTSSSACSWNLRR